MEDISPFRSRLHMDAYYDCKGVNAPASLSRELASTFKKISVDIARTLNLKGIIDVEAILNEGKLKVLEIDARLPSQTPTTVFFVDRIEHGENAGKYLYESQFSAAGAKEDPWSCIRAYCAFIWTFGNSG